MLDKFYQSLTEEKAFRILFASIACYVLVFFSWCYLKYVSFAYFDFDFAIHDQILWNLTQGRLYNSILGVNFLGNHIHFISFLIAPFYKIFAHPVFLLLLQTLAFAFSAIPIYKIAQNILGHRLALAVGLIFLLYPGLGFSNLYEFHPTCFAAFFLSWMFYFFFVGKRGLFTLFMVLALLCQENIALAVITLGIYSFITGKNRRLGLIAFVSGVFYFLICVKILLPHFNQNTIQFITIYKRLGSSYPEILKTILFHPLKVFKIVFQTQKIVYLRDMLTSLLFLPLLSPVALILSLPFFAQHLLSNRVGEASLYYHYTAELIPPLFIAFIFGLAFIRKFLTREWFLFFVILYTALASNLALGPHFQWARHIQYLIPDEKDACKQIMLEKIPSDAAVVATFEFLPHLSHRKELYSFHHVYDGFYTLSDKPFVLPESVEYALIDFKDRLTFVGFRTKRANNNLKNFLTQWQPIQRAGDIILFKRKPLETYAQ
jgi:uncharacterized membrane protein